ncbi:glycosyltransferase family 87 protein [Streptomyces sp. NBC_01716]|uniref:glycosyltransferase family 87 protein n=1 Tax=Streptomyces sp. NBC_01716 TaxID=2975917 RepID=UPI002E347ABB|nr:glycosyltransferase family 87 protein [Streptomyces sp. NBC_01716]
MVIEGTALSRVAAATKAGGSRAVWPVAVWLLTRTVLMVCVLRILVTPGADVTPDVSVTYQGWYDVLRSGTFPRSDVTWQYPPGAAFAILSPALLPFLGYATAFFTLCLLCDALVFGLLLHAGRRPGRSVRGAWVWVAGVALLGPTGYARYDLMVTAVAVCALLVGLGRPQLLGALAGFGALLKVWPVLLLIGTPRGRATRLSWSAAVATALALLAMVSAVLPGALDFLTAQRDRGTEVESLGALVFHVARHLGWDGAVMFSYGSVEFMGPYVPLVSALALLLSVAAFGWLLVWRVKAATFTASTLCDAAFAAVLLFTVTSRVISPQYLIWLVGLAAVCLLLRSSPMALPAVLVVAASAVTVLEFPVFFSNVTASDPLGVTLLVVRNGLLVAATLTACGRLWRGTVPAPRPREGQEVASAAGGEEESKEDTYRLLGS